MAPSCDDVFAPVETRLAARPASKCCGCCCGLRVGTIVGCAFNCLYFLGEATQHFTIIASILAGDHAWLRYLIFGSGVVVYGAVSTTQAIPTTSVLL